ncbi:MAG: cell division protein ZapA, partial [Geminicoccaceae bacterium]|nr:cell division protein ZapA [Geminicoccaceae bacterium]
MPMLEIAINSRPYNVQCGEGEEVRLKRLAQYVDARV